MEHYLDVVIEKYKGFVKEGKIVPLSFNFPSFEITPGIFNRYAVDFMSDKVRLGVDAGYYGLQKFDKKITYDDLVDFSERNKNHQATGIEKATLGVLLSKIIPSQIEKDANIDVSNLRSAVLNTVCVRTMDLKLAELITYNPLGLSNNIETKTDTEFHNLFFESKEKNNFIATLLIMKDKIPQAFKGVYKSLEIYAERTSGDKDLLDKEINPKIRSELRERIKENLLISNLVNEIKDGVSNPNIETIKKVAEFDERLAIEKYPKQMKNIFENNKAKKNELN
jgi:hypothetical protein